MDLIKAVVKKDKLTVDQLLENYDANIVIQNFTPLWCSITGTLSRPHVSGYDIDFELVKLLLDNGADPNKKCDSIPPIYAACFEDHWETVALLILAEADANDYAVLQNKSYDDLGLTVYKCKMPIVAAIENSNSFIVEILIENGALFNRHLINKAKKERDDFFDSINCNVECRNSHEELVRIIHVLEQNYTPEIEKKTADFMERNHGTNGVQNHFVGFEYLVVDHN